MKYRKRQVAKMIAVYNQALDSMNPRLLLQISRYKLIYHLRSCAIMRETRHLLERSKNE